MTHHVARRLAGDPLTQGDKRCPSTAGLTGLTGPEVGRRSAEEPIAVSELAGDARGNDFDLLDPLEARIEPPNVGFLLLLETPGLNLRYHVSLVAGQYLTRIRSE